MKKIVILSMVGMSFLLGATASKEAQANELALNLCTYVQADDSQRMRTQLRDSRVRFRSVYDSVVCNGSSLLEFSIENNATETAEFMLRQLPASSIDRDGIHQWAQENGYGDSEILSHIDNRVG